MSAEVWFYKVERGPIEPCAAPIVEKCLERGWRVLVRASDPARLEALDAALWSFREESFVPHGMAGRDDPARSPVWLTVEPVGNPNRAQALLLLDGAWEEARADFARVQLMFDGSSAEVVALARQRWRAVKAAGEAAQYWGLEAASGKWRREA
jgi:DNA polymerase-3 subunit chi